MTELKKAFQTAECEVVNFAVEDVVTTSKTEGEGGGGDWGDAGE